MMWPHDSNQHHAVTDEQLSAFADGQLSHRQARRLARLIRARPEYADRIHAYWRREAALLRALDPIFLAPVPPPEDRTRHRWRWTAAGLVAGALLSVLLWRGLGTGSPDFAELALRAYFDRSGAVSLGPAPPAPFNGLDLEPVSRRSLRIEGDQLVEYRYRDPQGRDLALYEMARGATVNDGWFHMMSRQDPPLVRWSHGDRNYVLIGDANLSHLAGLAMEMHGHMMMLPGEAVPSAQPDPPPGVGAPVEPLAPTPSLNGHGVSGEPQSRDAGLSAPSEQLATPPKQSANSPSGI